MPVIVTVATEVTGLAVIVNVAPVAPAGTVTPAGTVAAALLLDRVTTAPPAGAGPFRIAVPVEEFPPVRLDGLKDTDESTGGIMVRVAA